MLAKYIHLDDLRNVERLRTLGFQYLVESSPLYGNRPNQSDSIYVVAIPMKELPESEATILQLSPKLLDSNNRYTYLVDPRYFG